MEGLHCRDKGCDEEFVAGGEDFVAEEDADDVGGGDMRSESGFDPLLGEAEVGEEGDLVGGDGDG